MRRLRAWNIAHNDKISAAADALQIAGYCAGKRRLGVTAIYLPDYIPLHTFQFLQHPLLPRESRPGMNIEPEVVGRRQARGRTKGQGAAAVARHSAIKGATSTVLTAVAFDAVPSVPERIGHMKLRRIAGRYDAQRIGRGTLRHLLRLRDMAQRGAANKARQLR